jgi:hypothetical protein
MAFDTNTPAPAEKLIRGSGPGGSLTDAEYAKLLRKSLRTMRGMRARGEVAACFWIGRTPYTPAEGAAKDLNDRVQRAIRQQRQRRG